VRRSAGLAIGLLLYCADARAGGWQEVHQTSDDVRISVAPDGIATFEHRLRYRIVAGKFKALDVATLDPRGELVTDTTIVAEKGGEIAARVERFEATAKTPAGIHIVIDEGKGLTRGAYVATVKYKLDLVATKIVSRDGAMWRLAWTAPGANEGRDGARVVFELPPAPTEPRLSTSEAVPTSLATLHRYPDKDEMELVRPHVPKGEAPVWAVRVDPKALAKVNAPELRAPAPAVVASTAPSNARAILAAAALAIFAGALAFLLRRKRALVADTCRMRQVTPRPLVRLPARIAFAAPAVPFAYGATGAGAFAAFAWGNPFVGAALVVVGLLLATYRAPIAIARPRGPGAWREVRGTDVLVARRPRPLPSDALDAATTRGRLALLAILAVVGVGSWSLATRIAGIAVALPLACVVVLPVFLTGSRAQLPALPEEIAARMLRPARDMLARIVDLAHVDVRLLGRVLAGTKNEVDEIRLVCAPIDRTPGLRALELALAIAAPGPHGAIPEVLVRYEDGSPAGARIAALSPRPRVVPGRTPEEKVARLVPTDPTPEAAARLLGALVRELEGRRVTDRAKDATRTKPYVGRERRVRRWPVLTPVSA
jgi:hypothetical protein